MESTRNADLGMVESDAAKFYLAFILEFDEYWANMEDKDVDTLSMAHSMFGVHQDIRGDDMEKIIAEN